MSGHDNEDLIDYDEDHDIPNVGATTASNGAATTGGSDVEGKDKKNFSGIHATGFRSIYRVNNEPSTAADTAFQGFPSQSRVVACY